MNSDDPVDPPIPERGRFKMVDLLFRRIGGEDTPSTTLPAELIVRASA